jgi:hypothetical protein
LPPDCAVAIMRESMVNSRIAFQATAAGGGPSGRP